MQQPKHENVHNRKQFQIDRVAFFSDAVIAIAITLMVLEIKIPPLGKGPIKDIIAKYWGTFALHAAALFLCFAIIGNLWIRHHELFEHIINYNKRLIKSNLYFLLAVVLLPISISFMFEEGSPMALKLFVYFMNLSFCNLTYYFMLGIIFHSKNNFSAFEEKEIIVKEKRSKLLASVIFALVAFLALNDISWYYAPFFIWPLIRIVNTVKARIKKRNNKDMPAMHSKHADKVRV